MPLFDSRKSTLIENKLHSLFALHLKNVDLFSFTMNQVPHIQQRKDLLSVRVYFITN